MILHKILQIITVNLFSEIYTLITILKHFFIFFFLLTQNQTPHATIRFCRKLYCYRGEVQMFYLCLSRFPPHFSSLPLFVPHSPFSIPFSPVTPPSSLPHLSFLLPPRPLWTPSYYPIVQCVIFSRASELIFFRLHRGWINLRQLQSASFHGNTQVHVNILSPSAQVPPFRHGKLRQSSKVKRQIVYYDVLCRAYAHACVWSYCHLASEMAKYSRCSLKPVCNHRNYLQNYPGLFSHELSLPAKANNEPKSSH